MRVLLAALALGLTLSAAHASPPDIVDLAINAQSVCAIHATHWTRFRGNHDSAWEPGFEACAAIEPWAAAIVNARNAKVAAEWRARDLAVIREALAVANRKQ